MASKINFNNPFLRRWSPDFRYNDDKFLYLNDSLPIDNTDSVTDKESYRITLASLNGEASNGLGSSNVGSYSLKAGEPYDPQFDFSYFNRPDITIVDIDNYSERLRKQLEVANGKLKEQIENELLVLSETRSLLEKSDSDDVSE